jgi:hypothetical protein
VGGVGRAVAAVLTSGWHWTSCGRRLDEWAGLDAAA